MSNLPDLKIEQLRAEDIPAVLDTFTVWHKTQEQFEGYLAEQERGERTIFLAWLDEKVVGYVTILWLPRFEIFKEENIPEIVDLNVITDYQRQGIGTQLIQESETFCRNKNIPSLGISVELTPVYETASQLYQKLLYFPINEAEPGQLWHLIRILDDNALSVTAVIAFTRRLVSNGNVDKYLWVWLKYCLIQNSVEIKGFAEVIRTKTLSQEQLDQFTRIIERKAQNILQVGQGFGAYYAEEERKALKQLKRID